MLKATCSADHPELGTVEVQFQSFSEDFRGVIIQGHRLLEEKTGRKFDINKVRGGVR
jgi:hypothetical protein